MTETPPSARNFLPWSVTSRPLAGAAPTVDLVAGYIYNNQSAILELFIGRLSEISATGETGLPP